MSVQTPCHTREFSLQIIYMKLGLLLHLFNFRIVRTQADYNKTQHAVVTRRIVSTFRYNLTCHVARHPCFVGVWGGGKLIIFAANSIKEHGMGPLQVHVCSTMNVTMMFSAELSSMSLCV